jgi:hypothetical protein
MKRAAGAAPLVAFIIASGTAALGDPGDSIARERARLVATAGIGPLRADPLLPDRYVAHETGGATIAVDLRDGAVVRESLTLGASDGSALATVVPIAGRVFGAALVRDLRRATIVGIAHDGPAATEFRRGAHAGYLLTDDFQNRIHALTIVAPGALDGEMRVRDAAPESGRGDALFVLEPGGTLLPVALFVGGSAAPFDGDLAITTANALTAAGSVRVLADGQIVDTLPATADRETPHVVGPLPHRLADGVPMLASPTLGGYGAPGRARATERERRVAVTLAAHVLNTAPEDVRVRAISAFGDRGPAVALTAERRSADRRSSTQAFLVVLDPAGSPHLGLAATRTIARTEPLLEESAESYLGSVRLRTGDRALVTRVIGYDAVAYNVYVERDGTYTLAGTAGGFAR